MLKKFMLPLNVVVLMLLGAQALADPPKAVDAGVLDANVAPVDPIEAAEDVIDDAVKEIDKDPGKQVGLLIELAKSGRWGPFAGLLILFIVWATKKWLLKLINTSVLPWLTLGLAAAASIGIGLGFGNSIVDILLDTFITGGTAAILWSTIFKHLLKPKDA